MAQTLAGFPPLYYINLNRRKDRDTHMKQYLKKYKLNGTRVEAFDGSVAGFYDDLVEATPPHLRDVEIACTLSHLNAIRQWLDTSDSDTAFICEDDLSFDTISSWGCTWKDIESQIPHYWDIVQMCVIHHPQREIILNLHHRTMYDYSTACYLIHRRYAQKLMSLYWNDATKLWKLDMVVPFPLTSEEAVYRPGACLSVSLFTFTGTMGSDIQSKDHLDQYHNFSKQLHQAVWQQRNAPQLMKMWPLQIFKN